MNLKSLASNAIIAFLSQGVSLVVSMIMSLMVPKVLGVESYGYWQLFIFYASYCGFFHFGLNDGVYLIEGGKGRADIDKKSINSQFCFLVAMQSLIGLSIGVATFLFCKDAHRSFVFYSFALYTLTMNLSAYLGYVFQAMNETKLFSYMTILERLAFLVPMFVMVLIRIPHFEPFVVAYLCARCIALAYSSWNARDILTSRRYSFSHSISISIASIKVGFSLMVANVASMLILGTMRAMVDSAWGIEVFGRVSFALSIVNFVIMFVSQASMVLFPALRQGSDDERRVFYRGIRDMMAVLFPLAYLAYYPISTLLSLWLPQYTDSMHYLAFLLPVCVFETKMDVCGTTYFKVLREERTLLKVNLMAVFASALLSAIGVYLLNSVEFALLGAVISIIGRSLWSERYLNKILKVASSSVSVYEIIITGMFILLTVIVSDSIAFFAYLIVYISYLYKYREIAQDLVSRISRLLR